MHQACYHLRCVNTCPYIGLITIILVGRHSSQPLRSRQADGEQTDEVVECDSHKQADVCLRAVELRQDRMNCERSMTELRPNRN